MRKLIILPALFILIIVTGHTQKASVTWGNESPKMILNDFFYVAVNATETIQVSFNADKRFIAGFPGSKATPHIVRFDKKMQPILENDLEEMDKNSGFLGISQFGENIYFFSYTLSDREKTITYYAQAINPKLLTPEGEKKILANFDYLPSTIYFSNIMFGTAVRTYRAAGTLALSPDSTKLLLAANLSPLEKGTDNLRLITFEKDLKKSWDKTIQLPTPSNLTYVTNFYITNAGQACIAFREFKKKIDRFHLSLDDPNFNENVVKLIVCDKTAATVEQSFNIGNKFIHSFSLNADVNNNLVFFGLYQTKENGNINGYFQLPFDPLKKGEYTPVLVPFPQKICDQVLSDDQASKKDENAGIGAEFFINKVLTSEDGSSHYLLEYHLYHNSISTINGGTGSVGVSYSVNGDILDIKFSPDKTSKVFRIPKREKNAFSKSFAATAWNNKIVLLDYTFESSLTLNANDEDVTKGRGGTGDHVAIMTVVDDSGNFKKSIVYTEPDDNFTPSFGTGVWISNNRMALNSSTTLKVYTQITKAGMLELK
jgi:hypothetical protein